MEFVDVNPCKPGQYTGIEYIRPTRINVVGAMASHRPYLTGLDIGAARIMIRNWRVPVWHFSGSRTMSYPNDESPWRLEWNDGLSMYIPEIDAEHQRFILLVNELNAALIGRMDAGEIKKRMQALMDDAAAHFAHEEALFKEWGYPAAGEHAEKHALIMRALNGIMGRFEHSRAGYEYEWIDAGLQIKKALIGHLLHDDMKYRDYYLASGRQSGGAPGGGSPGQTS